MQPEFSRADIADLEAMHRRGLEIQAQDGPTTDPEEQIARRTFDAGLRVLIGLAKIALDREAALRNAATDALR